MNFSSYNTNHFDTTHVSFSWPDLVPVILRLLNRILNQTYCTCHHYNIHDPQSIHGLLNLMLMEHLSGLMRKDHRRLTEMSCGTGHLVCTLWRTGKDVNTDAQTVTHWATDHLCPLSWTVTYLSYRPVASGLNKVDAIQRHMRREVFWCRIHLWFRLMGGLQAKSMTSQRNHAVTRWRICVTMATLWQQQDGGYVTMATLF